MTGLFSDHRWLMTQAIGWKDRPWVYLEGTTKLWLSVRWCVAAGELTWSKMSVFRRRLQMGTKKAKKVKSKLKNAMIRSCCDGWR